MPSSHESLDGVATHLESRRILLVYCKSPRASGPLLIFEQLHAATVCYPLRCHPLDRNTSTTAVLPCTRFIGRTYVLGS